MLRAYRLKKIKIAMMCFFFGPNFAMVFDHSMTEIFMVKSSKSSLSSALKNKIKN